MQPLNSTDDLAARARRNESAAALKRKLAIACLSLAALAGTVRLYLYWQDQPKRVEDARLQQALESGGELGGRVLDQEELDEQARGAATRQGLVLSMIGLLAIGCLLLTGASDRRERTRA